MFYLYGVKMRKEIKIIPVLLLLLCTSCKAGAENEKSVSISEVKIYQVPWDILTRAHLSEDGVRRIAEVKITLRKEHKIKKLLSYIGLSKSSK